MKSYMNHDIEMIYKKMIMKLYMNHDIEIIHKNHDIEIGVHSYVNHPIFYFYI